VKVGYLKEFIVDSGNRDAGHSTEQKGNPLPPPLGMIKVIHATSRGATITRRGVLIVAPKENCLGKQPPEKRIKAGRLPISFDEEDLEETIQPHNDALVVTAWISSFLVQKGDDRLRKWGRHNVPGPIRRIQIKKSGLDEI